MGVSVGPWDAVWRGGRPQRPHPLFSLFSFSILLHTDALLCTPDRHRLCILTYFHSHSLTFAIVFPLVVFL